MSGPDIEHAGWAVGGPGSRLRARERLREERPFIVERGSPGDGLGGLWLLFGGIAAIVLGVPAAARWRLGSLKA